MILISCFVSFTYTSLIAGFIYGFNKTKRKHKLSLLPKSKFSIIIAFRNEEYNLPKLITSLSKLNYPKELFEVLLIDDHSQDKSYSSALTHTDTIENFRVLKSSHKSKKNAISTGIDNSNHNWIITTDADCIVPSTWLSSFDNLIQNNNPNIIAGPVKYKPDNSFIEAFQTLELLSLQGVTIGAFGLNKPIMCNGANLCYSKEIFNEVHGFKGNINIASGDDTFLLQKIFEKDKGRVHFLCSEKAIVETIPEKNISNLINQRIRWSAKTTASKSNFTKLTAITVLLMNIVFIQAIINLYSHTTESLLLISTKVVVDYLIIHKTAIFMNQQSFLKNYITTMLIYPFFSIYVAFFSLVKGYTWKGRTLRK